MAKQKPVQPERPWRGVPLLRCSSGQSSPFHARGAYLLRARFDSPVKVHVIGNHREPLVVCEGNSESLVRLDGTVRLVIVGEAVGEAQLLRWAGGPT